jgi:hypothetical protein
MGSSAPHPTPEAIMKIGTGFWASKVLLSAVHFELFTLLAEKSSQSASALKATLGLKCTDRHFFDFLDALTGFGFLTRTGILVDATYANSPDTDLFLDKKKPTYIGGMLEMLNNRLYGFWGNLEEGLRSGTAQNEIKGGGDHPFTELYKSPELLHEFVHAMSGIQKGNFMFFAKQFDFSKYKTLTDVGGSAGILSVMVAGQHPHMTCTTFDLPPVEPIAQETIVQSGLGDRVKALSGDFFTDPVPPADVVVMGNILHDWDEEKKLMLMQKAYDALPAGGAFVAIENVIDDERKHNVFGMLMSLNMLIETGKGFDYTFGDFKGWAEQVGFKSTELIPLAGPSSAAVAYK